MEAKTFHADGRTGGHMTKLMIAFRNFVNAPNKSKNNTVHAIISEIKSIPQTGSKFLLVIWEDDVHWVI
jgi:hypothetical protein